MRYFLIFTLLISVLYGKKDFYYSFIDDKKSQIDQANKDKIILGNSRLKAIDQLVKDGDIEKALEEIISFRSSNKIEVLKSAIELMYSEILYKSDTKKNMLQGAKVLENALNKSIISESDVLEATLLLVKLQVKTNKYKEAKFNAESIKNIYKDPLSLAYGRMAEAHIETQAKRYKNAINILLDILRTTKDLKIATVVADELYDVYLLNKEDKKAYELATKVLERNIDYYANDSYLALKKVDKLLDAKMPELAIKILNKLLENSSDKDSIATFKFKLANAYMSIFTTSLTHILKAKEIYKELINGEENPYINVSKMALDEIFLRENRITPNAFVSKYKKSDVVREKAMVQEILNFASKNDFKSIEKYKKVYKEISPSVAYRFGYEDIESLLALLDTKMIKYYLSSDNCKEINNVLQTLDAVSVKKIINESNESMGVLTCMYEAPQKTTFENVNEALKDSKNGMAYLTLERIAFGLKDYDRAMELSSKIDGMGSDAIKSAEFLDRFVLYGAMNNSFGMDKFFTYASKNKKYIVQNKNNPQIIDFYYQYYLYLLGKKEDKEAVNILKNLYNTQKSMKAFVYSPYVEQQMAYEAKLDDNYDGALRFLDEALKNPRRIKPNDLVKIYFEKGQLYKIKKQKNRYEEMIEKCKSVEKADSKYKEMCTKL